VKDDTKKVLGIHFGLLLAETICVSAFILEMKRALTGNSLSWAYVVEWPIFSVYAVYLWRRLLNEELRPHQAPDVTIEQSDDPALAAFNEYLRKVHGTIPSDQSHPSKTP
jgi:hypothetical protein